ncbi:MAG: T9SS type A sorting domain-containing protein [Bacteroidota bacterium]
MKGILFLLFIFCGQLFGQGISNRWVFGYSCCAGNFGATDLDFNSGAVNIVLKQRYMDFYETNGIISDQNGNLLFASNGIYVANALDDTMLNGTGINPSAYTTIMISNGLALPQGNIVIPFPDDSTKYYLFHETIDYLSNINVSLYLYYSVIDMTLDGGLGAVVQKNTILLTDSLIPGRLTACKHANGRDWWLVVHQYNSGMVYKYLVTPQGISNPVNQDLFTARDISFGQNLFSPQGDKFAYYEPYNDLDIFSFDRCTGDFSNFTHIDINDSAGIGGAAFSASGRYLYISSLNYIYQFDVQSSNIDSSKVVVGVYDGYQEQGLYQNFYLSALAPDGKIYINCGDGSKYFHVINSPDSAGLACNFVQRGLPLPRWNAFTIPNYPNYFLGADGGTVCDSLPTDISDITEPIEAFSVFPNPVRDLLFVNHSTKEPVREISIVNSLGQMETIQFTSLNNDQYLQIDLSGFASGVYYVQMRTEKNVVSRKILKE